METETAIDYLVKEFSEILGKIVTNPIQDLLMVYAINKAKEKEKQQIIDAYIEGINEPIENPIKQAEQYYNETFKD